MDRIRSPGCRFGLLNLILKVNPWCRIAFYLCIVFAAAFVCLSFRLSVGSLLAVNPSILWERWPC